MIMSERSYRVVVETLNSMRELEKSFATKSVNHEGQTFQAVDPPSDWKIQLWEAISLYMADHQLETFKEIVGEIKNDERFVDAKYGVLFWNSLKKGLKSAANDYEPF